MTGTNKAVLALCVIGSSWLIGGVIGSSDLWLLIFLLLYVPLIVVVILIERRKQNGLH